MNDDYQKREIDVFLQDLRNAITRNEGDLNEIKIQTKKTNGSIADVKATLQYWKGVTATLAAVILVVVIPMASWLLVQVYSLNGTLDKRMATAINTTLTNFGVIPK